MKSKICDNIEQLKSVVDSIQYNYLGWQSVLRRKKYANMQFVEKTYELIRELYDQIEGQQKDIEAQRKDIEILHEDIKKQQKDKEEQEKYRELLEKQLGATARQLMKIKWQLIEHETERTEKGEDILRCKICGHEAYRNSYKTRVTECRFNGGKLIRYVCPMCGVIFGPSKFSALTQDDINDDYSTHYMGFHEGDSTQKELDAFYMLKPDKNNLYLNYGCGSWSKSLEHLRNEGYQVYGYEPYAPETDNPYMIIDKQRLIKMRFDGIYSNDVIEHLIDPVEEFVFMKGLLKNKKAKMSHSTSCYIYKHEVTRFHTHFFTGKSIEVLCEKVGLNIVEQVNEVETRDFICYLYEPKESEMDYTNKLSGLQKIENNYVLPSNGVMYGPYLTFGGEISRWNLKIANIVSEMDKIPCRITERAGEKTLQVIQLSEGNNIIEISSSGMIVDLEFVIENRTSHEIDVCKLEMLDEL